MNTSKFFLGFSLACVLMAGGNRASAGYSPVAASWLGIPSSARQAALSGALGGLSDDADALGINPAGLASLKGYEINALHNQWAQNLTVEHLALGQGLDKAGWALGGDFVNFGQVDLYGITSGAPVANGTFSPSGLDLYGGAGLEISNGLSLGVDVKYIQESLQTNTGSSAFAADFGLGLLPSTDGLSFGLALLNLGSNLESTALPLSLDLSGAFRMNLSQDHNLNLGVDGKWGLSDINGSTASLGAEYWYHDTLALRVGYRLASFGTLQGLAGLSAGVGVKLTDLELSYALTTLGDMGTGHQISLSYRFGSPEKPVSTVPTGLSGEREDGQATVTWREPSPEKVAGYNCYLKKPGSGEFKLITGKPITDMNLTLKHLKSKKDYVVGVTAVGKDGKESDMAQTTLETKKPGKD